MSRKPDYILKVKRASDDRQGNRVGAAWEDAKGNIAITLDVGIVLDWRMCDECHIMLFPNTLKA